MARPTTGFNLRVDDELYGLLKTAAAARQTSVNKEICERLRQSFVADDLREVVRNEIKMAMALSMDDQTLDLTAPID